jgi:Ca2+-binding EF-hand superfamily protein
MNMRIFAAAIALASGSAALAQAGDPMKAYIEAGFAGMDTNKDGHVDRPEFESFMRARLARQSTEFDAAFGEIDKNRDGRVSPAEARINAELAKNFKALDQSADGFLAKDELRAALIAAQMMR